MEPGGPGSPIDHAIPPQPRRQSAGIVTVSEGASEETTRTRKATAAKSSTSGRHMHRCHACKTSLERTQQHARCVFWGPLNTEHYGITKNGSSVLHKLSTRTPWTKLAKAGIKICLKQFSDRKSLAWALIPVFDATHTHTPAKASTKLTFLNFN